MSDQAASEARQQTSHGDPDLPRPDDPHGAGADVESQQPLQREVALPHSGVGAMDLSIESEYQRHGVLGDRLRGIRRHTHDRHPEAASRLQVDVVEARAAQGDQPDPGILQPQEDPCAEVVVDERADGVEPFGEGRRRRGEPRLEKDEFEFGPLGGGGQEPLVVWLRAEDGNTHGWECTGRVERLSP